VLPCFSLPDKDWCFSTLALSSSNLLLRRKNADLLALQ
jgi:hypothetical protein